MQGILQEIFFSIGFMDSLASTLCNFDMYCHYVLVVNASLNMHSFLYSLFWVNIGIRVH